MSVWLEVTPLDTLFFRGNEPMEAGQLGPVSLFPPPVSVIQGAIRTAVLVERGVSFADYRQEKSVSHEILDLIGVCGGQAPFAITAILLQKGGRYYAPAPASWFIDEPEKPLSGEGFRGKQVIVAGAMPASAGRLSLVASSDSLPLVVTRHHAVSLAGAWVAVELFASGSVTFADGDIYSGSELYAVERRTGIKLDGLRKVEQGHLYSASHIRLHDDVTLLIGVDRDPGLAHTGILQLGGEQRRARYEQVTAPATVRDTGASARYVALAPVEASPENLSSVVTAYQPVMSAGWDLLKGFHKPTTTWYPAGSVFSEKIAPSCLPLTQNVRGHVVCSQYR